MSGSSWEWMFVDDADAGEVGEAERELAERRDEAASAFVGGTLTPVTGEFE